MFPKKETRKRETRSILKGINIMKVKNVQISEDLFACICLYVLEGCSVPVEGYEELQEHICQELEAKLESMVKRQIFSQYKTASDPTEREKLRQEYLNRVGVLESFRSASECPTEHL